MAREDLISFKERSAEEVKKIAAKGGVNSGKARRAKKTLKEGILAMLDENIPEKTLNKLEALNPGIKEKITTFRDAINAGLINQAALGDSKAFSVLRDTIGEKPVEKKEITNTIKVVSDSLSRAKNRIKNMEASRN